MILMIKMQLKKRGGRGRGRCVFIYLATFETTQQQLLTITITTPKISIWQSVTSTSTSAEQGGRLGGCDVRIAAT